MNVAVPILYAIAGSVMIGLWGNSSLLAIGVYCVIVAIGNWKP